MDIQYFGGMLLAIQGLQGDNNPFTKRSVVDDDAERRFFPRIVSFVVAVGVVLVAVVIH